jgi:hypothetical protein
MTGLLSSLVFNFSFLDALNFTVKIMEADTNLALIAANISVVI